MFARANIKSLSRYHIKWQTLITLSSNYILSTKHECLRKSCNSPFEATTVPIFIQTRHCSVGLVIEPAFYQYSVNLCTHYTFSNTSARIVSSTWAFTTSLPKSTIWTTHWKAKFRMHCLWDTLQTVHTHVHKRKLPCSQYLLKKSNLPCGPHTWIGTSRYFFL